MLMYKSILGPSVHKYRQIGNTTSSVHTIDSHPCSHVLYISGTNFLKSLLKIWKEAREELGKWFIVSKVCLAMNHKVHPSTVSQRLYLHGMSSTGSFIQARFTCLAVCVCSKKRLNGVCPEKSLMLVSCVTRSRGWKKKQKKH